MSEVASLRRYYVLKRMDTARDGNFAISAVWQARQEAAPAGVAFPANFPSKAALNAAGYEATEDLVGADVEELADYAGLSARDACNVLAAAAALQGSS